MFVMVASRRSIAARDAAIARARGNPANGALFSCVPMGSCSAGHRATGVAMQVWLGGVLRLLYQPAASDVSQASCLLYEPPPARHGK